MFKGRLTISIALACVCLGGAFAELPAPAPAAKQAAAAGSDKAFLEENPQKLKAFSCGTLDEFMATNYRLGCLLEMSPNGIDNAIGREAARKFKAQRKEYKSRCKGEPAKLAEAKKSRGLTPCRSMPNA